MRHEACASSLSVDSSGVWRAASAPMRAAARLPPAQRGGPPSQVALSRDIIDCEWLEWLFVRKRLSGALVPRDSEKGESRGSYRIYREIGSQVWNFGSWVEQKVRTEFEVNLMIRSLENAKIEVLE
ncbi:hypothetical protein KQX54_012401 [Cotesia glomerata]|uniref:Uncharacterized protein n=1 Tax=Cotesia glomerata TaxID=32391 RepID=A0AAV7IRE2_COTGL|nr:hypothetical protein KQX54_012401 [Cotesia glomerata]